MDQRLVLPMEWCVFGGAEARAAGAGPGLAVRRPADKRLSGWLNQHV